MSLKSEQYNMIRVGLILFGIGFGILLMAAVVAVPVGWARSYGLQIGTMLFGVAGNLLFALFGFGACMVGPKSRDRMMLILAGGCLGGFVLVAAIYWVQIAPAMYQAQGRPPNTFFMKLGAPVLLCSSLVGAPLGFAVYCKRIGRSVGGGVLEKFGRATVITFLTSVGVCIAYFAGMSLFFYANDNHYPRGEYGYDAIVLGFQLLGIVNIAMFFSLSVIGSYTLTPKRLTE